LPESEKEAEDLQDAKKHQLAKLAGGWLTSKLMGAMAERKIDIRILKVKPENFAELIALIYTNRVNSTNALKILVEMLESGADKDPTHIMEEKGYGQIADGVATLVGGRRNDNKHKTKHNNHNRYEAEFPLISRRVPPTASTDIPEQQILVCVFG